LKIRPTSRFVSENVDEWGEVIILVGTRISESSTRSKSIKKHSIKGRRLTKHPVELNSFVYQPIKHLSLEEVWYIINTIPSPWNANNEILYQLYANASADDYECPTMVADKSHKSCGQSRFGCWTCTVVREDKSMKAQFDNGQEWLKPLLELRNFIVEERNKKKNRNKTRRDGSDAHNELGSYTFKHRAEILTKLLEAQRDINLTHPEIELISNQELIAIQVIWYRDMYFQDKVSDIYNKIIRKDLDMNKHADKIREEEELLLASCEDNKEYFELIQDLLDLEKTKTLMILYLHFAFSDFR
jgi:DNA sulfur modification protein DndC